MRPVPVHCMTAFYLKHWGIFSGITVPIGVALGYPPGVIVAGVVFTGLVLALKLR